MKNIKFFLFFFLLIVIVDVHAQPPPPFPDDVEDVPPQTPVDEWIIPVTILSSIMGCYVVKKNVKKQT